MIGPTAHPEQIIGNSFSMIMRLKNLGIRVHKRPQAIGSAVVASLRDSGYEIVTWEELERLRKGRS